LKYNPGYPTTAKKESRMRAIFISYRREDAEGQAGRLFDDLVMQFGEDSVFMDVAGIEPGRDFRRAIEDHVASCGVLLAVLGTNWLDGKDESGRRRLDDPMDFVRLETASALKRDIPVIPVLVRGASMPRAEQLPPDIAELAYRNAVELSHARWDSDVQVLVNALRPYVKSVKLQNDVGTAKTEPAAKQPATASRTNGSSSEARVGDASTASVQSSKKRLRSIIAMSVAAITVAVGGYLGYESMVNRAAPDKVAESNGVVPDQGDKVEPERTAGPVTSAVPKPDKETGSEAVQNSAGRGDLLWSKHTGRANGDYNWASNFKKVGDGWDGFTMVTAAGTSDVIYGVTASGDLMWSRHTGKANGDYTWASTNFRKVGDGWNGFIMIAAGGGGVLYGVQPNGDLMWSKHTGAASGDYTWASSGFRKVGDGWNGFTKILATPDGILYGVTRAGELMWSKHTGMANGDYTWASSGFRKVGDSWNSFTLVAAAGTDGVIYGVKPDGELLWSKHTGRAVGDYLWETQTFRKVGDGWNGFKLIFSGGLEGVMYGVKG
jgi:hypothetical protein